MDFFGLLRIMLRRWFIVIPVLVIAAVLGVTFIGEPEISYSSGGSALLVTQEGQPDDQAADESSGVNTVDAGLLLRRALGQQSYRASLEQRGLVSNFVIAEDQTPTILTIQIASADADQVLDTGQTIAEEARDLLADAAGGPPSGVKVQSVTDLTDDDVVTAGQLSSLSTSIALLPTAEPGGSSPYPPDLSTIRLVTELAQRPSIGEAVRAAAPSAGYIVSSQERDAAPIVNIGITTPNEAEIEPAYGAAVDAINDELGDFQLDAGAADGNLTVLSTLNAPGSGARNSSSIVRPAAGVALLGVAVACVLAVLVDGLILRRRAKKKTKLDDRSDREAFEDDDAYEDIDERELQDALDE